MKLHGEAGSWERDQQVASSIFVHAIEAPFVLVELRVYTGEAFALTKAGHTEV